MLPFAATCDFEEYICGWSNDDDADFYWTQSNGLDSQGLGPSTDHTSQLNTGDRFLIYFSRLTKLNLHGKERQLIPIPSAIGFYLYASPSGKLKGDTARIISTLLPPTSEEMCFKFW